VRQLAKHGFLYDSSMMGDVNPYRLPHPDGGRELVELPYHWSLDDAPFVLFSVKTPRPIMTNSHIREIWQEEFREIYRWGGFYNLVMHPQLSGRPSRIALLREMIAFIQGFDDVWFARCGEVADAWAAQEQR